jgi:hypothetical protein
MKLRGLKIGKDQKPVTSIAYADDITVILRDTRDLYILKQTLKIYEEAAGAQIDWAKSSALPIGKCTVQHTIEYTWDEKVKIIQ